MGRPIQIYASTASRRELVWARRRRRMLRAVPGLLAVWVPAAGLVALIAERYVA